MSVGTCPQCAGLCASEFAVFLDGGYLGCPVCKQVLTFPDERATENRHPDARAALLAAVEKMRTTSEDPALLDLVIAAGATFSRQGKPDAAEMYNQLRIGLLTVSAIDFPVLLDSALAEAREQQKQADAKIAHGFVRDTSDPRGVLTIHERMARVLRNRIAGEIETAIRALRDRP